MTPPTTALTYEQAREELNTIVSSLESGDLPLENVLDQWERGEALLLHCRTYLGGARARIDAATAPAADPSAGTQ